jgi:pullulanase/glycogen debranching enzyme
MTEADWNDSALHCLALQMGGAVDARAGTHGDLLAVFNAGDAPVEMTLPQTAHGDAWRVVIDTVDPGDPAEGRVLHCKETLRLLPRSTLLLESCARTE